jgi:hypothetical protein
METLRTLGIALGLASLAGINLYLTVFVTGLAVQQHWIILGPEYQQLSVLAHPAVIAISGIMFVLQFFADKVPWVDSLWDAVHTFIKPVGGAFLAIRVLGNPDPVFDVVAALLAGGVTTIVHSAKAGTRLIANHSPEPFSNIALSVTEDVAVIGGLALIKNDPIIALVVFSLFIAGIVYFGPKLWRAVKVHTWLVWKKLTAPAADDAELKLDAPLPADVHMVFHNANLLGEKIAWAVPCVSSAAKRIPGNVFGWLVATENDPATVWFVAKRRFRQLAEEIDLATYKVAHEPKFLGENLVLYSLERKPKYLFVFHRGQTALVKHVAATLQQRLASVPAATVEPAAVLPG